MQFISCIFRYPRLNHILENTSAQKSIERLQWPKFLTRFLLAFDLTALNFQILFSLYTTFLEVEYIGSLRLVDFLVKMLDIYF